MNITDDTAIGGAIKKSAMHFHKFLKRLGLTGYPPQRGTVESMNQTMGCHPGGSGLTKLAELAIERSRITKGPLTLDEFLLAREALNDELMERRDMMIVRALVSDFWWDHLGLAIEAASRRSKETTQ